MGEVFAEIGAAPAECDGGVWAAKGELSDGIAAPEMAGDPSGVTVAQAGGGLRPFGFPLADVGCDGERAFAGRLGHLGGDLVADLLLAAGDDHVGARFREGEDHLATESAAAAGDERDLPLQ